MIPDAAAQSTPPPLPVPEEERMQVLVEADGTIRIAGELDFDTAGSLDTALAQALSDRDSAEPLTLDMSEVTFCDSTGLNTLLRTRLVAESGGIHLTVRAASEQVDRLFLITGTAALFGRAVA